MTYLGQRDHSMKDETFVCGICPDRGTRNNKNFILEISEQ